MSDIQVWNGFLLTLTDMSCEEGSCHPWLLVVSWATVITALSACVVFAFAAKLLQTQRFTQKQKKNTNVSQICQLHSCDCI